MRIQTVGNVTNPTNSITKQAAIVAGLVLVAKYIRFLSVDQRIGGRRKGRPTNLQKAAEGNNNTLISWVIPISIATTTVIGANITPLQTALKEDFFPLLSNVLVKS